MPERITAPCRDCPDRKLHCHRVCERYRSYQALLEAEHEKRRKIYDEIRFITAVKRKSALIGMKNRKSDRRRRR